MAAVNPLQRLRQDPKACFADDDDVLGSNTAGHFWFKLFAAEQNFVSRRLPLKKVVVTCTTSFNNKELCSFS
jgi:hypothetical protein